MKPNLSTNIVFIFIFLLTLTSCSTALKRNTAKTMDIYGSGVIQKPVIVDLDVEDKKITGTATATSGSSESAVKELAVANALKEAKADVLVEPKFEVDIQNGKMTATVTGFPARYKNFRSIRQEDTELLKAGIVQKAEVYQPSQEKQRKGAGAVILTTLGIIGLAAALILIL